MTSHADAPWALSEDNVAQQFSTSLSAGLNESVASSRLSADGPNRLQAARQRGALQLFFSQFADLMVVLLAAAALISGLVGDWADTLLIAFIVLANAVIGFVQEWKADQAIQALKKLSQPMAHVLRNQQWQTIPAENLVRGDLLELRTGDFVPADARVVSATALEVNESPLTGESLPVEKHSDALPADTSLPDRTCMVYSGTPVVRGHGQAIVTATGQRTELGRIADLLHSADQTVNPLQLRLASMTRWIAGAVVLASLAIFIIGVLRESGGAWNREVFSRMLLTSVSLAVAAVPEGLPAVISITLALGSQRMAQRQAIIRKLSAVETLGSVNVICSDKTGTLTQNRMTVSDVIPTGHDTDAEERLLQAAVLCNNAEPGKGDEILGSATEAALLDAARDRGVDPAVLRASHPRVEELPFSSQLKLMVTLHDSPDGIRRAYVKGAADRVVALCRESQAQPLSGFSSQADELARSGRRVLAVAWSEWNRDSTELKLQPGSLELLGFFGLSDPIRPEAREAIQQCKAAGIHTVMITGDHPETARAISTELGMLSGSSQIVTGAELERMSDEELRSRVEHLGGCARVSPEHKLRVVQAFQSHGKVVGMTGDGVNDAPALKQADIGIAMGITGTDVAKEAAELVLADDNFATIVGAVEEGRIIYDNIRKFVAYLLTANSSEVLVLLGAVTLDWPLPLLPVHLLWINLVTDGLPALALGFEPGEPDIMQRPPRSKQEHLLSGGLGTQVISMGLVMALCCLGLYYYELSRGDGTENLARARTITFFTLATSQLLYVCGIRSLTGSLLRQRFWSNYRLALAVIFGIAVQLATVWVPPLRNLLHLVPLTTSDLLLAGGVSAIPLIALELDKIRIRRVAPAVPHV